MKKCKGCGIMKYDQEYGPNKRVKSGLLARCRACMRGIHREYTSRNKEKTRQAQAKWRANKRQSSRAYFGQYRIRNRDKVNESNRKYVEANRPNIRKRQRAQYAEKRLKAMRIISPDLVCVKCGFSDMRALQIDHVHGGGTQERLTRQHALVYSEILAKPIEAHMKYQLLCANCNWIKRAEQKEHVRCKYD